MKVKINKNGLLVVKSQTEAETVCLKNWVRKNVPPEYHTISLDGMYGMCWGNMVFDWRNKPATVSDAEIKDRIKSYDIAGQDYRHFERFAYWLRQEMIDRNCGTPAATPQAPPPSCLITLPVQP
jgi:hypothetical protein